MRPTFSARTTVATWSEPRAAATASCMSASAVQRTGKACVRSGTEAARLALIQERNAALLDSTGDGGGFAIVKGQACRPVDQRLINRRRHGADLDAADHTGAHERAELLPVSS